MSIEKIDLELCNGCGICVSGCPMDVLRLDTRVVERNEFAPCRQACPAGTDMRSYFYLLKEGNLAEAFNVLRESIPLPAVTGRICPHPCESECARNQVDNAVNINSLERFVADYWLKERAQPIKKIYKSKVAVIGSGPAGLSAGYFLARMGYPVTIFEAMPVLGGMLRSAIPDYRLPKDVLDLQINYIRDMGVDFQTGVTIGEYLKFEELCNEYDSVFIATGNQLPGKIKLDGAELDGVLWGLDFLRDSNQNKTRLEGEQVVVIGGGNVAIDAAITALRLGAKDVALACLESDVEMPAFEEGIHQAQEEGVNIITSHGVSKILGSNGRVSGVMLPRCESLFDDQGIFNPCLDLNDNISLEASMIILAIGQKPDPACVPKGMKTTEEGAIVADPLTLETSTTGVFAGGDIIGEAGSVVEAIAAGKKASVSIDLYLKGNDIKTGRESKNYTVVHTPKYRIAEVARQSTPVNPHRENQGKFDEIKPGFTHEAAIQEVMRCTTCGSRAVIQYPEECMVCEGCVIDCPENAIYVSPEKLIPPLLSWG